MSKLGLSRCAFVLVGRQGTGRAADLIADALEIYEEELMRGGSEDSDAPDIAVMQRNQARTALPSLPGHFCFVSVSRSFCLSLCLSVSLCPSLCPSLSLSLSGEDNSRSEALPTS